jgi:hypothetical protein
MIARKAARTLQMMDGRIVFDGRPGTSAPLS